MKKRISFLGPFITGTLSLTITGILSRCLGFLIRIFLSYILGEEGMGIMHLSMPVLSICMAVCGAGIQSALSKLIADYSQKQPGQDVYLLRSALLLSLSMAAVLSVAIYSGADFIATRFLQEPRCGSLLRMLALSLPFGCIHSCCCGYYYGNGRTRQPAISQLMEQLIRAGTLFILWAVKTGRSQTVTLVDVTFCTVLSEAAAALYIWSSHHISRKQVQKRVAPYHRLVGEIIRFSAPISGNRLTTTLLMSLENMMIPVCLRRFGLSDTDALSLFGVLSGMSMPFIMFPATVTNSMAVLLLPKIAAAHSSGNNSKLSFYSRSSIGFSLGLGCFCTAFFYLTGPTLGSLFFHSDTAGSYIRLLSLLCPFIYLGITCASILNGLGKTVTVFIHNILSFMLRLLSVIILIPTGGINGYLLGLLTAELLLCTLHVTAIRQVINKEQCNIEKNQSSTSRPFTT